MVMSRARRFTNTTDRLIQRLWNWSYWARDDTDVPRVAITSIYDEWQPLGAGREEGWGEPESAPVSEECDEEDAEVMDAWVMQLTRPNRAILCQRFVLRRHVPHLEVDAAVRALADMMEANWAVVDRMEGR